MPEFENKIATWRAEMSAALPGNKKAVSELEEHLRDHVEVLCRSGKTADEAFADAVQRIGLPQAIGREFGCLRSGRLPVSWTVRAVWGLLALLVALLFAVSAFHVGQGQFSMLLAAHVALLASGYLTVMAAGLVGLISLIKVWRCPLLEWERSELRQQMWWLTVASCCLVPVGFGLGMVWLQLQRGFLWSGERTEAGALMVLISSWLLLIAQLRLGKGRLGRWWIPFIGVFALAFARYWFGTSALTAVVPIGWLWLAFIVSQIAIAVLSRSRQERETSALAG